MVLTLWQISTKGMRRCNPIIVNPSRLAAFTNISGSWVTSSTNSTINATISAFTRLFTYSFARFSRPPTTKDRPSTTRSSPPARNEATSSRSLVNTQRTGLSKLSPATSTCGSAVATKVSSSTSLTVTAIQTVQSEVIHMSHQVM